MNAQRLSYALRNTTTHGRSQQTEVDDSAFDKQSALGHVVTVKDKDSTCEGRILNCKDLAIRSAIARQYCPNARDYPTVGEQPLGQRACDMQTGQVILITVLVLSSAFGIYRKQTDGRVRETPQHEHVACLDIANQLGSRATLLQFSSAFCQPCKATRVLLNDVVAHEVGVAHIEVNAEDHLDLVKQLGIMRTPTTLVLDHTGAIVGKAVGLPKRSEVNSALSEVLV